MTASSLPTETAPATALPSAGPRPRSGRALGRALVRGLGAVLVPAIVSLLVLRYGLPSRVGGAGGGLTGFLAQMGDRHPLLVGLATFLVLAEVVRYWSRHLGLEISAERASGGLSLRWRSAWIRLVAALVGVMALAFLVRSSVVATFRVVGPSMLPTLELGDRVLVNRLAYGVAVPFSKSKLRQKAPARGDLVVFPAGNLPGTNGAASLVKRVIGLPGDRLMVDGGGLLINGWRVPDCDAGPYAEMLGRLTVRGRLVVEFLGDKTYLTVRNAIETDFSGYFVRSGEVFVMGDDRGLSSDSRLWNERRGAGVPFAEIEGRVSRVLLGARPDGRLDFSRVLAPAHDLKVRMPGLDMSKTIERINNCLQNRPAVTSPPPPADLSLPR